MPAGDATGPFGLGPMTRRAAGYCAGASAPGYLKAVPLGAFGVRPAVGPYAAAPYAPVWPVAMARFGRGFGRGRGRGFRRGGGRGWRRLGW
ncbi:MAG: DUF5320 domain-containing protein [Phycisphaerae bacterium]